MNETPILLLTGYLGSGKTTLVNNILTNKKGIKFAVIVNDIGEINIDAALIQKGGVVMGKWYDDYKKLDLLGGKISFIIEDDEDMIEIHYKDGMLIDVGYIERMHSYFITVVSSDTIEGWKQPVEEVKVEDKTVLADKIQETIYKYRR